jgi:TP901 family phage tail tape measure protein
MATNGGQVIFDVGFNVNSESLKAVREELKSIQSMTTNDIVSSDPYSKIKQGLRDAQDAARDLDNILQDSFNQDLGVMNIAKFQQGVEKSYGSLNALQARLSGAGDVGASAFRRICTEIITTNSYVKKTDELVSKMATTLGNTLKWNISSSIINKLTGSIQEAWGYTKALDGSLNDIQIVTNKSSEDMAKFAVQANNAAKSLKTTTTAYTDAALTFYQQGLSDEDVAARAETSLKVSNVTGLSGDQSAEYVTAVLNGYKVAAEDAEGAMDKLAAVGAATASSLAELSEGMAKVASAANAMGVSEDQLAATLSTVISVTRQDASTVGTAFKTIYARISDIKAGTAEAEISLGNYTKKMAEMGFSVLDSTGNMRDLGEVIEEIGGKWATLSREQQISLAQTMAGTRQYNNLIALFDNWADYEDALNVSMQANGTLQKQQEIYAESLTAKLNGLKAAKEDLFDSLVDTDSFKDLIEIFTKLINVLSTFVDGIGGGGAALAYLGSILTKVFNKQIAGSIKNLATNLNGMKQNAENAAAKMQMLKEMTLNNDPYVANFAKAYEEQLPLMNSVSEKTREIMTATLEAKAAIDAEAESYDNAQQEIEDYFKAKTGENYQGINEKDEFNQKQNNQLNVLLDEDQETFSKAEKELTNIETKYERLIELQEELDSGKIDLLGNSDEVDDKLNELINLESYFQNIKTEDFLSNLQTELDNAVQLDLFPSDFQNEANEIVQQLKNAIDQTGEMDLATLMGIKEREGEESLILILSDIFERAGVKFEEKIEEMKQQASEVGQQQGANIKANQEQAKNNQQDVLDAANLEAKIKKYTDLASSIMGVVGAVQTLQNLGNIWNNDDISTGEKMTQTVMALSGAFVALIPTLQTLIGQEKLKAAWDVILAKTGNSVLLASLALVAAFAALTVVIIGVVKLLNLNVEANKRAAEAAQNAADSAHEQTEALREEKEAIDAIVSGYEELYDQYKNGQITLEELRQKTYDLCMQYGQEDLALKALIADQEELNNLMKEAQSKADSELYDQSKKEAGYDKDAIKRGIMADAGKREDSFGYGKSTIDLKGMGVPSNKEKDFTEELKKAGIDFENKDHISTDSLVEAYTENYDELMEVLSKYSDLDAAAQIGEYLDNQKDNLDNYKEAVDTEQQLFLENELKSRYDENEGFKEGQNFHKATTESAEAAANEKYGARTEENAEDWDAYYAERLEAARNFYAQYSELTNDAMAEEINESLAKNKIVAKDMQLTQEQFEYLYLHLDTAEAYNDLNEFLRVYEKDIEIANSKTVLLDLDIQLADEDKEAFTDEELASYFGLEGFQDAINMSLEQLKGIDFKDQKIALMGATQKMKTELLDSYTEAMKSNQEDLQAISDKLSDSEIKHNSFLKNRYQNFVDEIGTGPQEALNEINDFEAKKQEIENTYIGSDNKDVRKEKIEELKQEYDSILNLEKAYGDLDNAKKAITYDSGAEDYYSYLEVEQELQALQEQGIGLNDIDTTQQLQEQQTALQENIEKSKAEMESLKSEIISMNETAANSAQSLRDLNDLKEQGAFVDIEGTTQDEGKAAYNKRAGELYEAARMEDLDSEEVRDYAHSLKDMADNSEELSDDLKDNLEDCQDLAIQIKRMNKGVDSLSKNWDEWSDILKNSSKTSEEYTDAMSGAKEAMADLLDVTEDFISDDFVTENMEDIAKAADGDADAIDRLRSSMLEDIVMHLDLDDSALSNEQLLEQVNNLQSMLDSMGDLQVGAEIDDAAFIAACNEMIEQAGLTQDQVNALFSGMGFDVNLASSSEPIEYVRPEQITHTKVEGIDTFDGEGGMPSFTYPTSVRTWTETVNRTAEKGEVGAVAMSTDGSTPEIKSVTKKAGGSMNNKSSSNSGGGKKGGGGGGAKADKKNYKDAKTNRYHDVEVALKDINSEMERLNKNRELLTGVDLAASYQKELELLDKEINVLTEKQRLQKEEAEELRSKGHTVQKNGEVKQIKSLAEQGVTFDDQGNISNYNEAIVNKTNEINQMIDDYNKLSADQQTDELKKQIEDAEFAYDQFMEDISRYETLTQDEMIETANAIADALNKKIELKIEKFSMTIDLKLETREAENVLENFQSKMEKRDKTAAGRTQTAANKFMNYMDKDTGVQAEIDRVNKIKEDIQNMQNGGHSDVYSEYDEESGTWVDNIAAAQEDLKKYTEQMMSDMESIEDLMDEINQGLLDTFDEIQEGFDDQIAGYEAVSDHIEHNISLIEQLYGDESSDKLGEWYDAQYKNSLGKVDMLKKEADFWQKQMENAENDDAYKKAKENWMNSMNELNTAVEDTLDIIIASYENSIDQIFDKLNSSLTDGLSLDYVGEEWELMNQNADRYLDTINSTYEVQKLQRKYQQSINDTDSLSAQKKLNDLMQQEIGYLEEKDKLTQYDIDRANLKYEIALKQIALEEAQQNKSTLRLKRDSQGNYSYQYAGDEEGVANKQQELAEAQNQLYNLDKDAYRQNLDDMYNIYSEFQSKMIEVAKIYGRESEEYEQYRVLYEKQYGDMINGILTENEYIKTNLMQSSYDALALMYETDSESFAHMTGLNMESFSEMTEDIVQQQLPTIVDGNSSAIETMIQQMSGEGGFQAVMQNVWSEIQKAAETYQKRIQEISSQSGTDLHDLQVNTDDVLTTLQGWVEENDKIIENAEASKTAYDTIAAGVKNLADQYDKAKQEAINTAKESTELQKQLNEETWKELEAQKALDNLVASLKEWNSIKPEIKTFKTVTINESSGGGSGSGGGGGGGGSSSPSSGTTPSISSKAKQFYIYGFSTQCSKSKTRLAGPYSSRPDISKRASWQKAEIRSFKSGGYTGRWLNGSQEANGRLALLHQKELVLNEDDTSNLLDTIKELRHGLNFDNLTEAMSSQMKTVQQSSLRTQNQIVDQLSHIISAIDNLSSAIVEQQVSINAIFEDARSSQDIMNAIDQLTNRASQMAFNVNRKR